MVYQPWQPPAKVLSCSALCVMMGKLEKNLRQAFYQMSDLCPTPEVCEMAVELSKVGETDSNAELHVSKYKVVGLSSTKGSLEDSTQAITKQICEFYSSQFREDNQMDRSSITRSAFEETSFGIICSKDGKGKKQTKQEDEGIVGAITFKYFEGASTIWILWFAMHGGQEAGEGGTEHFPNHRQRGFGTFLLVLAIRYVVLRWTSSTGKGKAPTVMLQCNADEVAQSASTRQKDLSRNNNCWLDTASTSPSRRPEA